MQPPFHQSVDTALKDAKDPIKFEVVAYYALRDKHPDLELTAPSNDAGKDLQVRRLKSTHEDVRVMVSLQEKWAPKLDAELDTIEALDKDKRPATAIFVTTQNPQETTVSKRRDRALALGVGLEVVGRTMLAAKLNDPSLRWVAESHLGVEPLQPRTLQTADQFVKATSRVVPGFDATLLGRDDPIDKFQQLLNADDPQSPRLLVIEGPGGMGKTRLAVECASRAHTTFVAPGTVPLPPNQLTGIPAGEPAVLIVDDAHRCPDLSGVLALMRDQRFDHTKVVLTTRPGMLDRLLAQSGLTSFNRELLPLGPLPREVMAQLVRDWGIGNNRFATTVIDIARGNPLIAHAMCEIAIENGQFGGPEIINVLNTRITARLAQHAESARAVAVALALASSARGEDLGAYRSAVTRLPPDPDIAETLELLADVGIAQSTQIGDPDGQSVLEYSIKPDLLSAALIAESLNALRGTRLKLPELLGLIGLTDTGATSPVTDPPPFGTSPIADPVLTRLTSSLAHHQVNVLAQAAAITNNTLVLNQLASTILALVPPEPTVPEWTIVFRLAEHVVGYTPWLFRELQTALTKSGALRPSDEPTWWFETPEAVQRHQCDQLSSAALGMVERHGAADPPAATELALTVGAALLPHVQQTTQREHGRVGKAIALAVAPQPGDRWDDSLARRAQAVEATASWLAAPTPHGIPEQPSPEQTPPGRGTTVQGDGSAAAQPQWRADAVVALDVLTALMNPVIEHAHMGSPESADVLTLNSTHLPETEATETVMTEAAGVVAALLNDLPLAEFANQPDPLLRSFIALPRELWATGARGMPFGGGALPDSTRTVLASCSRLVEEVFAERWDELPTWARYEIVRSVQQVRPTRTLKQRARAGSRVARRALTDGEILRLLVLAPTERDLKTPVAMNKKDERAATRARNLARQVSLDEAISLLRTVTVLNREWQMDDPTIDFVDELARLAQDPSDVALLLDAAFNDPALEAEDRLVAQLAGMHPQLVELVLTQKAVEATTPLVLLDVIPRLTNGPLRRELTRKALDMILAAHDANTEADPPSVAAAGEPTAPTRTGLAIRAAARAASSVLLTGERVANAVVPQRATRVFGKPITRVSRAAVRVLDSSRNRHSTDDHADGVADASDPRPTDPVDVVGAAQRWVTMTWRLPDDPTPTDSTTPANGWKIDALIHMGLHGPIDVAVDVLQRATYWARRRPTPEAHDPQEPVELITEVQLTDLLHVLARALSVTDTFGSAAPIDTWEHASATAALARLAPENTAQILAEWMIRDDGISHRWPLNWRQELNDMTPEDRVPFGTALKSYIEQRFTEIPFTEPRDREIAQFDADLNVELLLRDSEQWRTTVTGWIDGPGQDLPRAAAALSKSWRSTSWPQLVDSLLAKHPSEQLLEQISYGLLPSSFGPDLAEELEPRFAALGLIDNAASPQAETFVQQTKARISNFLAEHQLDAERRRTGY